MLFPTISLRIEASYRNFLGLYNDVMIALGASYHFKPGAMKPVKVKGQPPVKPEPLEEKTVKKKCKGLEVENVIFENIFPVFFKYYNDHPVGRASLHNWEKVPIEDISVSLFVKQYMDDPKSFPAPELLKAGDEKEIELYALFNIKVLEISEGSKVSANITNC